MPLLISKSNAELAADIIRHAGGRVVGKTRLQKMAYLLEITDLGVGFVFEYRHYGPFSEQLADAVASAHVWDLISEEEHTANWGGTYSVFEATPNVKSGKVDSTRKEILRIAGKANPVSLELAATAAFLAEKGVDDPWEETSRRKPEKAGKFLTDAKELYEKLRAISTPKRLPRI